MSLRLEFGQTNERCADRMCLANPSWPLSSLPTSAGPIPGESLIALDVCLPDGFFAAALGRRYYAR